ncbi:MAG: ATP-grasp domain-containing protein [Bacteroidetes bacterium]|nr:ATP-grasp domain-containing protein [Bacteroidota bacterium]
MENKHVAIVFGKISEQPKEDELDVLEEIENVEDSLKLLGYQVHKIPFSLDIPSFMAEIKAVNPLFAFNLIESVDGSGELQVLGPAILKHMKIPYSGVPIEALFLTTHKILAKKLFRLTGIPTAPWFCLDELDRLDPARRYIHKPIGEDASVGINDDNVFYGDDHEKKRLLSTLDPEKHFVEEFIEGRELNISMIGGKKGPITFPPAEIIFDEYPEDKLKIVNYNAKWISDSYEYTHTPRTFDFPDEDKPMLEEARKVALRCWKEFGLKGYVRVDFRIDQHNKPFVLEINGNPCITKEAGFWSASQVAGLAFTEVIQAVIEDALD